MNADRQTLLVVDDEADIRLLVRAWLIDDFDILEAADGIEALELLTSRDDIDLVLLDIRMPGLDGIAVLERLQALELLDRYPIVAFSAHAEPDVVKGMLQHGARSLLHKPCSREDLTAALFQAVAS